MAIQIIPQNPNVKYAGYVLPADKAPYNPPVTNPNVNYNGATLPADAVKPLPVAVDMTNIPQLVVLGTLASSISPFAGIVSSPPPVTGAALGNGGIVLPADVLIDINGKKVVASTTILDGVEVTQHIRRDANRIVFEFVARARAGSMWTFAQEFIDALYQKIYLPNSVIYVQNTLLNKMGITQLVMDDWKLTTRRGSINVPITLSMRENIPGKSLNIA